MGEPLAKFWLFASVSGIDNTPNKDIKYKKSSVREPLAKFRLLSSVAPTSLDYLRRTKANLKKIELSEGTPCKIPVVSFS